MKTLNYAILQEAYTSVGCSNNLQHTDQVVGTNI